MPEANVRTENAENTNDGGVAPDDANGIHLVLQGKGGCGKSLIAGWLAEFLIQQGKQVHCVDGDPVNRSLSQYRSLAAENLQLTNAAAIVDCDRYDALVD